MISPNSVRSLEAFRVFEAAARNCGFSRAAEELGITHGAVSRRIALLEYDQGRLAAPRGFVPDGSEYCLISDKPIRDDPRKTLFLEWLRVEASETDVPGRATGKVTCSSSGRAARRGR